MSNVLLNEKSQLIVGQAMTGLCGLDLTYEKLDPLNVTLIRDAAICLAETFAGIEISGVKVSEPMTNACRLTRDDMLEFVTIYLENVVSQCLCYVAIENGTEKVVGVLACEDFNPDEEVPVFNGKLEAMNIIIEFLTELDSRFMIHIERKTEKRARKNEYIHTFMAGVKLENYKSFVVTKLFELLIEDALNRGYKGLFGEATNFRSIKMMTKYSQFHPVYDIDGKMIMSLYSAHPVFKTIPDIISTDCRILYRPLKPKYDL